MTLPEEINTVKSTEEIQPIAKVPLVEQLNSNNASLLKRYQDKVLGDSNLLQLAHYELATSFCSNFPGGIGYLLRKLCYRGLFKEVGSSLILGQGVVLRHPRKITFGNCVSIDDYALLDAVGAGETGISIGNDVIISRNCVIQGKTGPVTLGNKVVLGCNTILPSSSGIVIGNSVLIAANCYVGGGQYFTNRTDIPILQQGVGSKGPVVIGDDVWLGSGVIVLDGVNIGTGCVVGAGAVVTKDLPDYSVAIGVPAQIISNRKQTKDK